MKPTYYYEIINTNTNNRLSHHELTDEQRLANRIVSVTARDYQRALCGIGYSDRRCEDIIEECERFFHSDWYSFLTTVDGAMLMDKLRTEVEEYGYDYAKIKKAHGPEEEEDD